MAQMLNFNTKHSHRLMKMRNENIQTQVPLFAVGEKVKAAHNIQDFAAESDELEVVEVRGNGWYDVKHPRADWNTRFMARHRELLPSNDEMTSHTPNLKTP